MSDNQDLPLLYSYRRCPYAMRARLAMLQANRRFQTFEIVMRDKPAELLALSPKGTVPVLHLTDGGVLEESLDIMRWAFEANDTDGWWRRAQSDDNLALLRTNDGEFKRQLDRYKYPDRYPLEAKPRETARALATETLLIPLESRLLDQRYLGGSTPCATDLAIFPFVRQFAAVEPDWFAVQPLPAVQAWLGEWLGSRLFEVCMTKQPVQAVAVFPEYQHPN
ncbi:glutathione S-transferase [Ralstonia chuxiongensis]|uniref:Glutathione S-transferase n=1 Tax=Ralstonia chuxiongensis TaxID=2957504 RepID=A0AA41WTE5_9RALS|nr:glutathione S-transferase [Ralstonia chuxiongensis]MCP1174641.1 glutathione S-transferase [Ralstonia chuxiongensis]